MRISICDSHKMYFIEIILFYLFDIVAVVLVCFDTRWQHQSAATLGNKKRKGKRAVGVASLIATSPFILSRLVIHFS